ncbi:SDR family oxidoreductase [Streptomyces sp. NPDC001982]|uniref:SDR family oxidoreductase n=1 Tax=Streptomyces sp. NPDC001982 TaxID=3154405 RepID=UPI0033252FEE
MDSLFDLTGRTAVVTGGSRGLGRAYVQGLAEQGANVAILDIDSRESKVAAKEVASETGVRTLALEVDVASEAAVNEAFSHVYGQFGQVDVLVNNAGLWSNVPALDLHMDEWRRVVDVNLTGTLLCSLAAARLMIERATGSIINITSISGELGFKNRVAYTSTKHAVRGLTKSLANEWARHGVRVNAIGPGVHAVGMARGSHNTPEADQELLRRIPMGRMGQPEELLGAVVFLASQASSYITGQTIFSDGGWLLE